MNDWEKKIEIAKLREEDEEKKRKRKLAFAMRMRALEEQEQHDLDYSKGYCPICHMLRSISGSCSC